MSQCVAMRCSVLQRVAVCVTACCCCESRDRAKHLYLCGEEVLQCVAMCCSVLQCVLQRVAVCVVSLEIELNICIFVAKKCCSPMPCLVSHCPQMSH